MPTDAWNLPNLLATPTRSPRRFVVLHHECPTRGPHLDWMFEPEASDAPLPSARLAADPRHAGPGTTLLLEPGPDHRRAYLDADSEPRELSGGRGLVRLEAAGTWAVSGGTLAVHWEGLAAPQAWRATPGPDGLTLERLT